MEPTEIQEFSNQLKEANYETGGGEPLTHISLAISILAVLVATVTVMGHRTHTEAVLAQSRAGDQWNEYQAKKIRADNLAVSSDLLRLQPSSDSTAVEKKLGEYQVHLDKWKEELAEEQTKAREYETEVGVAERKADRFDLGEALLQIAVVMASITLFTRRRAFFYFGLTLGVAGVIVAAMAFLVH